ncbi:MAG: diadenylate cyclase CdaA [Longimicrobiales bacterium]
MIGIWDTLQLYRPGWLDVVEILLVSALIYRLLLLIHRTRAMQMLLGVLLLASVFLLARLLGFNLIERILQTLFQYGAIAALVIFQPELRSALARLGQSRMLRPFTRLEESQVVDEVVHAVERLARSKIGAIIALEQEVALDEYAEAGSAVEARVSADMIATIFTPYSPLHDGAVLVAGDQIRAAGAILPLTQYPLVDRSLGTRHRAALGLSEETDAIVVVVSEETSRVSVARRGRLERDVSPERLREILSGPGETAPRAVPGRTGGG